MTTTETPTAKGLTLQDVIERERRYTPARIEALLGIREAFIIGEADRRVGLHHFGSPDCNMQIEGDTLLHWIHNKKVPFKIQHLAVQELRARERRAAQEAEKKAARKPSTSAARAAELVRAGNQAFAESTAEDARRLFPQLAAILAKGDDDRTEDEDGQLVELAADLRLSGEEVGTIAEVVQNAMVLQDRAESKTAKKRHSEWRRAMDNLDKTKERHKKEMEEARKAVSRAETERRHASEAENRLLQYSRQWPELFDGDPPRLRIEEG